MATNSTTRMGCKKKGFFIGILYVEGLFCSTVLSFYRRQSINSLCVSVRPSSALPVWYHYHHHHQPTIVRIANFGKPVPDTKNTSQRFTSSVRSTTERTTGWRCWLLDQSKAGGFVQVVFREVPDTNRVGVSGSDNPFDVFKNYMINMIPS